MQFPYLLCYLDHLTPKYFTWHLVLKYCQPCASLSVTQQICSPVLIEHNRFDVYFTLFSQLLLRQYSS